jgi:serine/threonine protein kinase
LKKQGIVPEEEAKKILTDILTGFLELLRNGIIHRDLKPANILIDHGTFKLAGSDSNLMQISGSLSACRASRATFYSLTLAHPSTWHLKS